jgi:hypothetical protein
MAQFRHPNAIALKHSNIGKRFRRQRRKVIATAAIQIAMVGEVNVQNRDYGFPPPVFPRYLPKKRLQGAVQKYESVGEKGF